ncbi:unnamed protein product [Choristocarpus tenellus]
MCSVGAVLGSCKSVGRNDYSRLNLCRSIRFPTDNSILVATTGHHTFVWYLKCALAFKYGRTMNLLEVCVMVCRQVLKTRTCSCLLSYDLGPYEIISSFSPPRSCCQGRGTQ